MSQSGTRSTTAASCLAALVILLLTIGRQPQLLLHPRFLAEEGTNFFAQVVNSSFLDALLQPQFGYYTLYNTLVMGLAALVPLEWAPLVTTLTALTVQVGLSLMVINTDIPGLDTPVKRQVTAIALPLLAPGQVWLTTIGVQYWLCLVTFFLLLQNPADRPATSRIGMYAVLMVNGLTGILSCCLTPLFFLSYLKTRARHRLTQALLLTLCSLVQCAVYLQTMLNHLPGMDNRLTLTSPLQAGLVLYHSVISLFASFTLTKSTGRLLMSSPIRPSTDDLLARLVVPIRFGAGESMLLLVGLGTLCLLIRPIIASRRDATARLMLASPLLVYSVSVIFSVNSIGGPRYLFAPTVMLFTFMVAAVDRWTLGTVYQRLLQAFLVLTLLVHLIDYRSHAMAKVYSPDWPDWATEVAAWRQNPDQPLRIWPPPWSVTLQRPVSR